MNKIKTSKIATIFVMTLLLSSIMALTPMTKPAEAQVVATGGTPTVQGYYNTAGQYVSAIGGPLPSGVTPQITIPTLAFLSASPDPIGVGQTVLINIWTTPGIDVERYRTGYTVTITNPAGTKSTVGPMNSFKGDGTDYFTYTVDAVGTWSFQFSYPGDYYPAGNYSETAGAIMLSGRPTQNVSFPMSMYYEPSSTPVTTITVQQAMIASWPPSAVPGPGDYWTRPISPENREWLTIAGNFPAVGQEGGGPYWPADTNPYVTSTYNFIPYVQGPTSAHIVYRMQTALGGLMGGTTGQTSVALSDGCYNSWELNGWLPLAIYDGRAYQQIQVGNTQLLECYNLQTGQVYWQIPNPFPSSITLSIYNFPPTIYIGYTTGTEETPGGASDSLGAGAELVSISGGLLVKVDPATGETILNTTLPSGISSGTLVADPFALSVQTVSGLHYLINWTIAGFDTNFADRIVSNITWPLSSIPSTTDFQAGVAVNMVAISPSPETSNVLGEILTGYSLTTGQMLWNTTTTNVCYAGTVVADHGLVAVLMQNGGFWEAWNLMTGTIAWTSPAMNYPWGTSAFGDYGSQSAYGLIYRPSYDGIYAFNWTNGDIAWHFIAPSLPFETPYSGNTSFNTAIRIADGMVYAATTEHTPTEPLTRGWSLCCVNAITGQEIWNVTGEYAPQGIADGYLVAANAYDGYMYVFGMGQSATAVTAPLTTVTQGTSVLIQGTVMDKSAATTTSPEYAPGQSVPCVSDASMSTWMEYLYMQAPIGGIWGNATITGVPVTLTATSSTGTVYNIGTVTTNGYFGAFTTTWTPPAAGLYTISAVYAGDDSYGSSAASTGLSVAAPVATPTPTPTVTPPSNLANTTDLITYIAIAVIAIIIAIAIVGILILRKHA